MHSPAVIRIFVLATLALVVGCTRASSQGSDRSAPKNEEEPPPAAEGRDVEITGSVDDDVLVATPVPVTLRLASLDVGATLFCQSLAKDGPTCQLPIAVDAQRHMTFGGLCTGMGAASISCSIVQNGLAVLLPWSDSVLLDVGTGKLKFTIAADLFREPKIVLDDLESSALRNIAEALARFQTSPTALADDLSGSYQLTCESARTGGDRRCIFGETADVYATDRRLASGARQLELWTSKATHDLCMADGATTPSFGYHLGSRLAPLAFESVETFTASELALFATLPSALQRTLAYMADREVEPLDVRANAAVTPYGPVADDRAEAIAFTTYRFMKDFRPLLLERNCVDVGKVLSNADPTACETYDNASWEPITCYAKDLIQNFGLGYDQTSRHFDLDAGATAPDPNNDPAGYFGPDGIQQEILRFSFCPTASADPGLVVNRVVTEPAFWSACRTEFAATSAGEQMRHLYLYSDRSAPRKHFELFFLEDAYCRADAATLRADLAAGKGQDCLPRFYDASSPTWQDSVLVAHGDDGLSVICSPERRAVDLADLAVAGSDIRAAKRNDTFCFADDGAFQAATDGKLLQGEIRVGQDGAFSVERTDTTVVKSFVSRIENRVPFYKIQDTTRVAATANDPTTFRLQADLFTALVCDAEFHSAIPDAATPAQCAKWLETVDLDAELGPGRRRLGISDYTMKRSP